MQLRLSFSIADTLLWLDILISALSTMSWLSCNWYCICYLTFPFLVLSIQLDFHISGIVTTYWPSYFWSCHLQLDFHISDNVTTTWQSFYWYCHLWLVYIISGLVSHNLTLPFLVFSSMTKLSFFLSCLVLSCKLWLSYFWSLPVRNTTWFSCSLYLCLRATYTFELTMFLSYQY